MVLTPTRSRTHQPYPVNIEEYKAFRRDGYLVVKGLVSQQEIDEMNQFMDDLVAGRKQLPGIAAPSADLSDEKRLKHYERIHMPHRTNEICERLMLHPRVIDVLEALIGPDVLALQTMIFFKQPGQAGQGFHQDSYYIPTQPDTLCGAWIALDRATTENGCLWMTPGSQCEPIYPDCDGQSPHGDTFFDQIDYIQNASHPDTGKNTLAKIALQYQNEVPAEVEPGDVVFFGGHIFHRSHMNRSNHSRRSFVSHYCNARSRVPWNHGQPYKDEKEGGAANYLHILARGTTHLDYAQPRFGTPCAANLPEVYGQNIHDERPKSMMGDNNGFMIVVPHEESEHDH